MWMFQAEGDGRFHKPPVTNIFPAVWNFSCESGRLSLDVFQETVNTRSKIPEAWSVATVIYRQNIFCVNYFNGGTIVELQFYSL